MPRAWLVSLFPEQWGAPWYAIESSGDAARSPPIFFPPSPLERASWCARCPRRRRRRSPHSRGTCPTRLPPPSERPASEYRPTRASRHRRSAAARPHRPGTCLPTGGLATARTPLQVLPLVLPLRSRSAPSPWSSQGHGTRDVASAALQPLEPRWRRRRPSGGGAVVQARPRRSSSGPPRCNLDASRPQRIGTLPHGIP